MLTRATDREPFAIDRDRFGNESCGHGHTVCACVCEPVGTHSTVLCVHALEFVRMHVYACVRVDVYACMYACNVNVYVGLCLVAANVCAGLLPHWSGATVAL